jgi:hypothetical protein
MDPLKQRWTSRVAQYATAITVAVVAGVGVGTRAFVSFDESALGAAEWFADLSKLFALGALERDPGLLPNFFLMFSQVIRKGAPPASAPPAPEPSAASEAHDWRIPWRLDAIEILKSLSLETIADLVDLIDRLAATGILTRGELVNFTERLEQQAPDNMQTLKLWSAAILRERSAAASASGASTSNGAPPPNPQPTADAKAA